MVNKNVLQTKLTRKVTFEFDKYIQRSRRLKQSKIAEDTQIIDGAITIANFVSLRLSDIIDLS